MKYKFCAIVHSEQYSFVDEIFSNNLVRLREESINCARSSCLSSDCKIIIDIYKFDDPTFFSCVLLNLRHNKFSNHLYSHEEIIL